MLELLEQWGKKGVALFKAAVAPYSATGKTVASIKYKATPTGLKITARGFFEALETGRGPRKASAYSGFDKSLDEWAKARGFSSKKSKSGTVYYKIGDQWFSAKSLAWKINTKGDKKFRSGNRLDVYTSVKEEFLQDLKDAVIKVKKDEFKDKVINTLRNAPVNS
jgi:hypothetical protein